MENELNSTEYKISRLGAHGDGISMSGDEEVYIPYGLPGEVVTASRDGSWAKLDKILEPSGERVKPACRHFTKCGGCKLQNLHPDIYLEWKTARVREAFLKRGIECDIQPIWSAGPGQRRRAVFTAARTKKSSIFGFHQYRSEIIEHVTECPVLVPAIADQLENLRRLSGHFLTRKRAAKIGVTACIDGLDVWIEGARGEHSADIVERVLSDCVAARVQRLTVDGEILFQNGEPEVMLCGVRVGLPSGAFLQACGNAEMRMNEIIGTALQGSRAIADLFSGVGTFSFALARQHQVFSVENSALSLAALRTGSDRANGIKPVKTLNRDLYVDPMSAKELEKFDGVVFDPPRAGAIAQAEQLAKSDVANVVAVSCNPATLARDLRVLIDGGYSIKSVHPIDQFVYSPHVEVVAHLVRC